MFIIQYSLFGVQLPGDKILPQKKLTLKLTTSFLSRYIHGTLSRIYNKTGFYDSHPPKNAIAEARDRD